MKPKVFLLHGWSVTETTTYGGIHHALARQGYDLEHVLLGRYVSLEDKVQIRDLSRGLHQELIRILGKGPWKQNFHFITHSTGALVLRHWLAHHYQGKVARHKALKGVVFLAGPHFGSRLAHHGRSMLAQVRYLGDTGANLLKSLELGSPEQWHLADFWLKPDYWQKMGVQFFNLSGDRVDRKLFLSRLFPAAFEAGSDMVVRCPSANLNFQRFRLGADGVLKKIGGMDQCWFSALKDYTHSGEKHGLLNSIHKNARPEHAKYLNLQLIKSALAAAEGDKNSNLLKSWVKSHKTTRSQRPSYAQLQLRFGDQEGQPITDYLVRLGWLKGNQDRPSKMVVHTHKNIDHANHFTLYLDLSQMDPKATYFLDFRAQGNELTDYVPSPLRANLAGGNLKNLLRPDQTTQLDIVLDRRSLPPLMVFHQGDDPDLPVKWNRQGKAVPKRKNR